MSDSLQPLFDKLSEIFDRYAGKPVSVTTLPPQDVSIGFYTSDASKGHVEKRTFSVTPQEVDEDQPIVKDLTREFTSLGLRTDISTIGLVVECKYPEVSVLVDQNSAGQWQVAGFALSHPDIRDRPFILGQRYPKKYGL